MGFSPSRRLNEMTCYLRVTKSVQFTGNNKKHPGQGETQKREYKNLKYGHSGMYLTLTLRRR